jgi:hypothetical protein
MPLCRRGLTNADWFILNGIELGEADLDWLGMSFLECLAVACA